MNAKAAKIGVNILGALLVYLVGYLLGNKNKEKEKAEAVKKAIVDVKQANKKALQKNKNDFEEKLNQKNEVIEDLKSIIERLVSKFNTADSASFSTASTKNEQKLLNTLNTQLDKLNNL